MRPATVMNRLKPRALVSTLALAVALVPLATASSLGRITLTALAAAALLGFVRPFSRARLAVAAAGLTAYAGGAALPWHVATLAGACLLALGGLAVMDRGRSLAAATAGMVALALGLVAGVLAEGVWEPEALRLGSLAVGLALGAAAASGAWGMMESGREGLRQLVPSLTLAALVVLATRNALAPAPIGLPAWQRAVSTLEAASDPWARQSLLALDDLETSGSADAADALVALSLDANADPLLLRRLCPRRGRHDLDGPWRARIELGKRLCDAVRGWPEDGSRALASVGGPEVTRLRADLLMEAGLVPPALALYARASRRGDRFADRDAVLALLDRGRLSEAHTLGFLHDPSVALWLGAAQATPELWEAWNKLLDFDSLEPAGRRGLIVVDGVGELPGVYDREIGRRVVVTRTRFGTRFGVALPPTPAGAVPRVLEVWLEPQGAAVVEVHGANGTSASVECMTAAVAQATYGNAIPPGLCSDGWHQVRLDLSSVQAPLTSIIVRGELRLARVRAEP
jgi:hypothetical protein